MCCGAADGGSIAEFQTRQANQSVGMRDIRSFADRTISGPAMVVPLLARGRRLGAITYASVDPERYQSTDVARALVARALQLGAQSVLGGSMSRQASGVATGTLVGGEVVQADASGRTMRGLRGTITCTAAHKDGGGL